MNKRIFVIGSCVSRDALELFEPDEVKLVSYLARTSFASQVSPSVDNFRYYSGIKSKFQSRMVENDLEKKLFIEIKDKDFDIVLLDLIDDRFDLVEYESVGLATRSVEFMSTCKTSSITKRISHHGEAYDILWKIGFNRFLKLLDERGVLHKLRLNKVFWASENSEGKILTKFSKSFIDKENEYLQKRYAYAKSLLKDENFYTFENDVFVADSKHRWGESPFHYGSEYYNKVVSKIRNE